MNMRWWEKATKRDCLCKCCKESAIFLMRSGLDWPWTLPRRTGQTSLQGSPASFSTRRPVFPTWWKQRVYLKIDVQSQILASPLRKQPLVPYLPCTIGDERLCVTRVFHLCDAQACLYYATREWYKTLTWQITAVWKCTHCKTSSLNQSRPDPRRISYGDEALTRPQSAFA